MKKVLLSILLVFTSLVVFSQKDKLRLRGTVTYGKSAKKLAGVTCILSEGSSVISSLTLSSNDEYEFKLDFDKEYTLKFYKDGFISKSLDIDTRNVPLKFQKVNYTIKTDVGLLEIVENLEVFVLKMGKIEYLPSQRDFAIDADYVQMVMKKFSERVAQAQEENFNTYIKEGDELMAEEKFEEAIKSYEKAVKVRPQKTLAQKKISDAQQAVAKVAEAKAEQERLVIVEEERKIKEEKKARELETAELEKERQAKAEQENDDSQRKANSSGAGKRTTSDEVDWSKRRKKNDDKMEKENDEVWGREEENSGEYQVPKSGVWNSGTERKSGGILKEGGDYGAGYGKEDKARKNRVRRGKNNYVRRIKI